MRFEKLAAVLVKRFLYHVYILLSFDAARVSDTVAVFFFKVCFELTARYRTVCLLPHLRPVFVEAQPSAVAVFIDLFFTSG